MKKYQRAFVIGKFLPPHKGHVALMEFASSWARHVVLAVEEQDREPIPVDTRVAWLKSLVPSNVSVVPLRGIHPATSADCASEEDFWMHWKKTIKSLAISPDVIISSDEYGKKLAMDQGADWIRFDRGVIPISATLIKDNMWDMFDCLIKPAQAYFARHVLVVGPESTGKTTLARKLAAEHSGAFIPEYAEFHIKNHNEKRDPSFYEKIMRGQWAYEKAFSSGHRLIIEDSNALTTAIYARQDGHHDIATHLEKLATTRPPHLTFLSEPEGVPFVMDAHRGQHPHRLEFMHACEEFLIKHKWPYVKLTGNFEERDQLACDALNHFTDQWRRSAYHEWLPSQPEAAPKMKNAK